MDGVALARARAELGISRDQLSSYSAVSRETLRKIEELGYVPKAGTVRKIEKGLHKAAEELSVTQRLAALERQIDVLQSVVQALIVARIAQQDDFPVEK